MYKYYNSIMECTVLTSEKVDKSYMQYICEVGDLATEVYNAIKEDDNKVVNIFNHKKKRVI